MDTTVLNLILALMENNGTSTLLHVNVQQTQDGTELIASGENHVLEDHTLTRLQMNAFVLKILI